MKAQFEYVDKKGKLREAKAWYEPEASSIRDLFVQVGLVKQYEEGYRPLSGIEHSDATAFFAMVKDMEQSDTERRLEVQSDLFIPHYLRNAFQYFADIFRDLQLDHSSNRRPEVDEHNRRGKGVL